MSRVAEGTAENCLFTLEKIEGSYDNNPEIPSIW